MTDEEIEFYTDKVQDVKMIKEVVKMKVPHTYEKRRGGLAGLFGGTK
jgi:hypothetical protein